MIVDESNFETLDKVSKITDTDYDIRWYDAENIKGYIDADEMLCMIDDLLYKIDSLQEKIYDIEQDVQDNYKRIPVTELIGISDSDFI